MHSTKVQRLSLILIVGLLLSGALACDFGGGEAAAKPQVDCTSPVSGLELEVAQQVEIVCLAEDPKGVVSVELAVDGVLYATQESPNPEGQPQWKFVETWPAKVDPGVHTLTITAHNADKVASDPVSISVTVLEGPLPGATGAVTVPTETVAAAETTATAPSPGTTETASPPAPTPTTGAAVPTNTPIPPPPATNTPVPAAPTNTPVPPPTSTPLPGLPDLIIYAIYLDRDTVPYGETVHATVAVVNQGNALAGPFRVSWDFGSGSGGQNVPGLAPNQSYSLEWTSLPLYESYDTRAMADESQVVPESNEGNNTLLRRVNVTPLARPDLTVTDLTVDPSEIEYGGWADVSFIIRNVGNAPIGPTQYLYFWTGCGPAPGYCDEDCCVGGTVGGLAPGDYVAVVLRGVGPFYASYWSHVLVNAGDVGSESDRRNNWKNLQITVQ